MSGSTNNTALLRNLMYTNEILAQMKSGFLPEGIFRDLSAQFLEGSTLQVPIIGDLTVRDYSEHDAHEFEPISSSLNTLVINQFKATGTEITQRMREDSKTWVADMEAAIPMMAMTALKEQYETDMLVALNLGQTAGNTNVLNNAAHRWVAGSTAVPGVISLKDFVYAKFAMDKAGVPQEGRIAIVDTAVEAVINNQIGAQAFINNPNFRGLVETGFGKNQRFLRNMYGFDVYVSDRLPVITGTETINGGPHGASRFVTNGVPNFFLSVYSDMHMPLMGAWRRKPNMKLIQDELVETDKHLFTARYGFGVQRNDSLITVLTNPAIVE